jgi:hypothetical protein
MILEILFPTVFLLILAIGLLALSLVNNSENEHNTEQKNDKTAECSGCIVSELTDCKTELTTRNRGFIEVSSNVFHSSVATLS